MADMQSVALYDAHAVDPEVLAMAGFLAGYSARTREAYTLDLRQFTSWRDTSQAMTAVAAPHRAMPSSWAALGRRGRWGSVTTRRWPRRRPPPRRR